VWTQCNFIILFYFELSCGGLILQLIAKNIVNFFFMLVEELVCYHYNLMGWDELEPMIHPLQVAGLII
jgi:hypothetical protein